MSLEDKIIVVLQEFNEWIVDIQNLINEINMLTQNNNCLTTKVKALSAARAGASVAAPRTLQHIEVFADLGEYNGSKAKFEEWWIKMKAWLSMNSGTIALNSYKTVVTVLL